MYVRDILKEKGAAVVTITPDSSVIDAVKLLVQRRIGSLLVVSGDGEIAGILTERDILQECDRHYKELEKSRVADVMTKAVVVGRPTDTIEQVQALMTERRIRHLPIVEDGKLVGMISIGDVVKRVHQLCQMENKDLKSYISGGYLGSSAGA